MPIVPVNLLVDEKTYQGVKAGVLEICGMAKNVESKKIAKHIPAVADATKEGAAKAFDYVKLHKKGFILAGGAIVAAGSVAGVAGYVATRNKRKREKHFANCLQVYLIAAKNGELTVDMIDDLSNSLEVLSNGNPSKTINLKITASQFSDLIYSIFDYTIRLAKANNISTKSISKPKLSKKNTFADLQYYLNWQKSIFEQAA